METLHLSEPSGTQLSWTGSGLVTATRDPNAASIPVGGLIVSVGSTRGFGYQPLVGLLEELLVLAHQLVKFYLYQ